MKVTRLGQLRKAFSDVISNKEDMEFPVEITYYAEMDMDQSFKVTIEKIVQDSYIDSKGNKWVMVKECVAK